MNRVLGVFILLAVITLRPALQAAPRAGPVVDHQTLADFHSLSPPQIAAAAALRVLFIDHSVGFNISTGLDCYGSESQATAPNACKRFDHVLPELSADPAWFQFGAQYDRTQWVYQQGGSSYWREWPDYVDGLLRSGSDWDVVIMMPSYLVAPNGGWQPYEALEAKYPDITFVYATSSLPRGVAGGTAADQVMERFNADARAYAMAHGKPLLDVADLLSHDYQGGPCFDTRDGREYCQTPTRCENLPDDGLDIPAICQHYTTELYGGHLGSVSGGMLRMAQAMWLMMSRLAAGEVPTTPTTPGVVTPDTATVTPTITPTAGPAVTETVTPPAASATPSPTASTPPPTSSTPVTATATPSPTSSPITPEWRVWLPRLEARGGSGRAAVRGSG